MMTFQLPTFEQSNPWLTGAQAGTNLLGSILQNKLAAVQAQYAQPLTEQQLAQSKLQTQIMQPQAQYAPDITRAQLALSQAQTPYLQAETGKIQQEMPYYGPKMAEDIDEAKARSGLYGAQAGYYGQESKYLPLKYAIEGTQVQQTGQRFGKEYMVAKLLQAYGNKNKAAIIASDPEGYQNLINLVGEKAVQELTNGGPIPSGLQQSSGSIPPSAMLGQIMQKYFGNMISPSPYLPTAPSAIQQSNPNLQNQIANSIAMLPPVSAQNVIQQSQNLPSLENDNSTAQLRNQLNQALFTNQNQTQQPQQQSQIIRQNQTVPATTPNEVQTIDQKKQDLSNQFILNAAKDQSTASVNNRAQNGIALESWLIHNQEKYAPRINNAIQYAGLLGRSQKLADEYANQHNDAITDYDWYVNTFSPFMKNGVRYLEQMGVTDAQRGELGTMINAIDNVKSNPDRARTAINRYVATTQDVSNGVFDAAEPAANAKGIYRKVFKLPELKGDYVQKPSGSIDTKGMVRMQDQNGNYGWVPKGRVQDAIKLGGRLAQ